MSFVFQFSVSVEIQLLFCSNLFIQQPIQFANEYSTCYVYFLGFSIYRIIFMNIVLYLSFSYTEAFGTGVSKFNRWCKNIDVLIEQKENQRWALWSNKLICCLECPPSVSVPAPGPDCSNFCSCFLLMHFRGSGWWWKYLSFCHIHRRYG